MASPFLLNNQFQNKTLRVFSFLYLNNVLKTEDEDYVIAIDTDSIYITMDTLLNNTKLLRLISSHFSYC